MVDTRTSCAYVVGTPACVVSEEAKSLSTRKKGRKMKAIDFNLPKDIKFDIDTGVTTFRDRRLVLFNAEAMGLLRQNLIEELGWDKTRSFFLRFGLLGLVLLR